MVINIPLCIQFIETIIAIELTSLNDLCTFKIVTAKCIIFECEATFSGLKLKAEFFFFVGTVILDSTRDIIAAIKMLV